jgi:two-component system NarL family sensor kinase
MGAVRSRPKALQTWQPIWLPSLLCGSSVLILVALSIWIGIKNGYPFYSISFILSEPVAAYVGGLVIARQPRNPVGWLLFGHSLCFSVGEFARQYAIYGLQTVPGSLPGAWWIIWFSYWLWGPGILCGLLLLPLYFPSGKLVSPAWRWLIYWMFANVAVVSFLMAFRQSELETPGLANPFGFLSEDGPWEVIVGSSWFINFFAMLFGLIFRWWKANSEERNQLKWLLYSIVVFFIGDRILQWFLPDLISQLWFTVALGGVWISIGIAVLRYKLFNINTLIHRTVVYFLLSAVTVGLYIAIVLGFGTFLVQIELISGENVLLLQIMATGLIAMIFQPVRFYLQEIVSKLLFGHRDDPYRALAGFNQRLALAISPEEILPTVAETVRETLKLPYVAIDLNSDNAEGKTQVASGEPVDDQLSLPLVYQSEQIGAMNVGLRSSDEPFDQREIRLLSDLAQQVSIAAHTVLLNADLQFSRERLVSAREEERRRLQRDLHDGLGPTLAGLVMQIDAARSLLRDDPDTSIELLTEVKDELQVTIASVRQLVYQLWPLTLGQLGLVATLRDHCDNMARSGRIKIELLVEEPFPILPAAVELACYYIVIEALNNVIRHAQARSCQIVIRATDVLEVSIRDDGIGLSDGYRSGIGLHSIRERARELGGSCELRALPAGGTEVWVSLPREDHW